MRTRAADLPLSLRSRPGSAAGGHAPDVAFLRARHHAGSDRDATGARLARTLSFAGTSWRLAVWLTAVIAPPLASEPRCDRATARARRQRRRHAGHDERHAARAARRCRRNRPNSPENRRLPPWKVRVAAR